MEHFKNYSEGTLALTPYSLMKDDI